MKKAIIKIDGFKKEYHLNLTYYRNDILNGFELLRYLQRFHRFTPHQASALQFGRYKFEYLN